MDAIVVSYALSERSITRCGPELLYPRMLIWRNRLVRKLSSNPVSLLGKHNVAPEPCSCERRRACSQASPNNGDICPEYLHIFYAIPTPGAVLTIRKAELRAIAFRYSRRSHPVHEADYSLKLWRLLEHAVLPDPDNTVQ